MFGNNGSEKKRCWHVSKRANWSHGKNQGWEGIVVECDQWNGKGESRSSDKDTRARRVTQKNKHWLVARLCSEERSVTSDRRDRDIVQ